MNIVERVQAILLRPKETWPKIAAEPATPASIYRDYLVVLAAIPAVCGFIGWTLIGLEAMGASFRLPIATGLVQMVVGYLLSLAIVYVMALVVNALAPRFGGSKDFVAALKVVAFGSTAGFVGGVLNLLPSLAWLGLVAAIYSIVLIYLGLPVLMRCAPEKAGTYTAIVVACSFVATLVLAGISSLFVGDPFDVETHSVGGLTLPELRDSTVQIQSPDGSTVTIRPGAMVDIAKRIEEAGKRMESAQKSVDGASASLGAILGAVAGSRNVEPIAPAELRAMLPESIGELKRTAIEAQGGAAMGFAASTAKASYAAGDRTAELAIADTAGLAGIASMTTGTSMKVDKDADGKLEKVYKDGTRVVQEEVRKDGSRAELVVILANGIVVTAEGNVDIATLKRMVESVDLAKLEATKRVAKR